MTRNWRRTSMEKPPYDELVLAYWDGGTEFDDQYKIAEYGNWHSGEPSWRTADKAYQNPPPDYWTTLVPPLDSVDMFFRAPQSAE